MFACLKNLFGKKTAEAEGSSASSQAGDSFIKVHKAIPKPPPAAGDERPEKKANPMAPNRVPVQRLSLPLEPIVQKFPDALKEALPVLPSPNQKIELALEELPEQLKRGSVRVTFGEIRKALPSAFEGVDPAFDRLFVSLPIGLIVPRVKLDLRSNQREVRVPSEGVADFDLKRRPESAAPFPAPPPLPTAPAEAKISLPVIEPVAAAEPDPEPVTAPASLQMPNLRLAASDDARPLSEPTTMAAPATAKAPEDGPAVRLAVSEIEDYLSGGAMAEVSEHGLEGRVIHVPADVLAPMVDEGEISVSWGQVLSWMRPTGPQSEAPESPIRLPLSLIEPRFREIAAGKAPSAETDSPKDAVQPEAFPSAVHEIDLDDLTVENVPAAPEVGAQEGADEHHQWRPAVVTARLRQIEGVEGVVIASRDGFIVASDVSPHIEAAIMAAFLPDIVVRTTVYVTEMNLSAPGFIEISLGHQKLLLAPAGELYLGVLTGGSASTAAAALIKQEAEGLHQFGSIL